MIEIKVPTVGESISEVTLIKWLKKDGDYVERDEVIAEFLQGEFYQDEFSRVRDRFATLVSDPDFGMKATL